jgi:DNA uptake protein ComE-like DNA-binding protein
MKKHILIAIALVAAVILPLTASTRSSRKTERTAESALVSDQSVVSRMPKAAAAPENKVEPAKVQSRTPAPKSGADEETVEPPKAAKAAKVPAKQSRARQMIADLTSSQQTKLLAFLNDASVKELALVNGISTTRGAAIERSRPFEGIDEVILVKGIGEGTFAEIVKHGKTLTLARTASSDDTKASSTRKSS